jgi:hypothetical protein
MSDQRIYMYGILNKDDADYKAIIGIGPRKQYELRILRRKWPTDIGALKYLIRFFENWWKLHPIMDNQFRPMDIISSRGDIISNHERSGECP